MRRGTGHIRPRHRERSSALKLDHPTRFLQLLMRITPCFLLARKSHAPGGIVLPLRRESSRVGADHRRASAAQARVDAGSGRQQKRPSIHGFFGDASRRIAGLEGPSLLVKVAHPSAPKLCLASASVIKVTRTILKRSIGSTPRGFHSAPIAKRCVKTLELAAPFDSSKAE